jgi:hypothetical protein
MVEVYVHVRFYQSDVPILPSAQIAEYMMGGSVDQQRFPPLSSMRDRILQMRLPLSQTLIAVLAVIAIAQASVLVKRFLARTHSRPETVFSPPVGTNVANLQLADAFGHVRTIRSVGGNSCVYMVVYSKSCSQARLLAAKWTQDAQLDGGSLEVPPEWKFVWVSIDEIGDSSFFRSTIPLPT